MNQDVQFDDAALDRICERINGLRAFIRTVPHVGALIDVDTLLAVANAEAARLRSRVHSVSSAAKLSGKPAAQED